MAVDCGHCEAETADPRACGDCGGVFCADHEDPLTHECPALESVVVADTFEGTTERRRSRSLLRAAAPWAAVVVATVLSLAVVGVATGVFTPTAIVDTPGEPTAPSDVSPVPAPTPPDPDPAGIRNGLLSDLNEWRAGAGYERLERAPGRRSVLDRMAADLAVHRYFEDPAVRDHSRFSPRERLAANGLGCANVTRGFVVLAPENDRRSAAAFAGAAADMLRPELAEERGYRTATVHDVGVHVTSEGAVYIAYVAC